MITIKNLSKTYNNKVKAVDDLSVVFENGEIIGFIGPNGAGKTTTLKMITGITLPDSGSVDINGFDIEKDAIAAKKEFGFVPDNPDIFLRLKGIEYLNFLADIYQVDKESRIKTITNLAEQFAISDALNDKIISYSHGMRQKIVIIGALLHNPNVWILDEPMTGLDPQSSFIIKQMMIQHSKANKTVLFSTHVLDVAEKLCDKVAIINKGKLLFYGTLDELKIKHSNQLSLEEIFLKVISDV